MNKYEFYYQVAQARLTTQHSRNEQMELKAGIVIGFSGTMIKLATLTVGLWNAWSILVASITCIAFLWTAGLAIAVLWVRQWDYRPDLGALAKHVKDSKCTPDGLALWVGDAYCSAEQKNDLILKSKAEMLIASFIGLGVEGALVGMLLLTTQL